MELIDRLRAWSYARQRLGDPARTPMEALKAVVAVYATHPTCPLVLWARTRSFTADGYRRIDRDARGVRIPAMRKTLWLVPREHAGRVFAAARLSPAQAVRALKRFDIDIGDYERIAARVLAAARDPVRAKDLAPRAGIEAPPLGVVLRCLRYEGRLLALAGKSISMSAHLYVATSERLPEGLDTDDRTDALAWLAGAYLRSYGPARSEDFAWWAGVSKKTAAEALRAHPMADLGDGLLLRARDEAAFDRTRKLRGTVDLLPKWDAYTMGHAPDGRARFVHPDVQSRVYTPVGTGLPGDGNPVVLVNGEAVGIWAYTLKEGPRLELFDDLGPSARKRVEEKLEAVAALLEA